MPKILPKSRSKAYIQQSGRCIYCEQPMWLTDVDTFANTYQIRIEVAKHFKCTAEHLTAKQDGGTDAENNIVAACSYCNQKRHKRKKSLDPFAFKRHVMKRLAKGLWHLNMINKFVEKSSQRFPGLGFQHFGQLDRH